MPEGRSGAPVRGCRLDTREVVAAGGGDRAAHADPDSGPVRRPGLSRRDRPVREAERQRRGRAAGHIERETFGRATAASPCQRQDRSHDAGHRGCAGQCHTHQYHRAAGPGRRRPRFDQGPAECAPFRRRLARSARQRLHRAADRAAGFHSAVRAAGRSGGRRLAANLDVAGTIGAPLLSGSLSLAQGELDLYQINLAMRETTLKAILQNNRLDFDGAAQFGAGHAACGAGWSGAVARRTGNSRSMVRNCAWPMSRRRRSTPRRI